MSKAASPAQQLGHSGLPIPRFVSLKTEKVNVRKGPSSDHDVARVYQRKGLPDAEARTAAKTDEAAWGLPVLAARRRKARLAYG